MSNALPTGRDRCPSYVHLASDLDGVEVDDELIAVQCQYERDHLKLWGHQYARGKLVVRWPDGSGLDRDGMGKEEVLF